MTYDEKLLITLIDKGALALLILIVGFGLNWYLERRRARAGLQEALAAERAKSYGSLWALMDELGLNYNLAAADSEPLTFERRGYSDWKLDDWYFAEHGAMYLSHQTTKLFFVAKYDLMNDSLDNDDVEKSFSKLRTQMKRDCGIYTSREAKRTVVPI
jgi:hypothetical protein